LRTQHWAISDLNPWLAWLGPAAAAVKAHRRLLGQDIPARRVERMMSELMSASLEFYRELRDAVSEVLFYQIYGNLFSFYLADRDLASEREREQTTVETQTRLTQEALASAAKGGYAEALARVGALLTRPGASFPLARLHLKRELAEKFADLLPDTTPEQQRHIRGMQDLIVRQDPELALCTLPQLVAKDADRLRLRDLLERVMAEEGIQQLKLAPEQRKRLQRIKRMLSRKAPAQTRPKPMTRAARLQPARKAKHGISD
jgi:hypothetical protein